MKSKNLASWWPERFGARAFVAQTSNFKKYKMKTLDLVEKITLELCAALFEKGGDYSAIESGAVALVEAVENLPDDCEAWPYLNDTGAATPSDLIEGLYWHFAEWHGGQSSDGYAALSALGGVFQPGACSNGPEADSAAENVYVCAGEMAAAE